MVRKLAGHKGPVCGLAFTADKTHLISVSDDKCIKLWDVPTEQELASITAHQDYVKACAISASGKLFVTGSYDHTIKIWDTTNLSLVMEINTSAPVESVLISPNAALIISSGSNSIKFWDISLGGKLLHSMSPHQKTITSLAYSSNFSCILTGALDRHVKVVDLDTYKITQVFKLPGTVMSVACNSSDTAIAFGLGNGVTILRTRNISTTPSSVPRETVKFNFVVSKSSLKLSDFEKALKGFRFRDALDLCLAKGNPELILACCTELIAYDALSIALSGRDEAFVACILKFIGKALTVPEFSHVTLEVLSALLEIYDGKVCCWREFREALSIVLMKLNEELRTAKAIGLVSGQLEMICSANSLATAL
jgi:U3 small nucleolar RNA-associated protein 15